MNETICGQCKQGYAPKRKNQKYCSGECQRASLKGSPVSRICVNLECGNSFTVSIKSDPKKYCSRSCSTQANNFLSPKRKGEGKCEVCKVVISASRKFCNDHSSAKGTGLLYEKIPVEKVCKNDSCDESFITLNKNKFFCDKKCSNDWSRINLPKDSSRQRICPKCSGNKAPDSVHCQFCYIEEKVQYKVNTWLSGEWRGGTDAGLSNTIRRYLLEQAGYACCKCGFNTMHPVDNQTVLEINHIDGDGENHTPTNLEVICPNCHSLTPNYRARNMGKGRNVYYLRISK